MIVVGVDTNSYGFHWVASDEFEYGMFGWARGNGDADTRRLEAYRLAVDLFSALPHGSHVFCEEPLSLKNGKTTRLLALAAGAVWSAFQQANRDSWWHWVDVATWKKTVLGQGYGNASKEKYQPVVRDRLKSFTIQTPEFQHRRRNLTGLLEASYLETDLLDAWCIEEYGVGAVALAGPPSAEDSSPTQEKVASDS